MIQRVQSIYMFFAVLFMIAITYFLPVLVSKEGEAFFTSHFIYAYITILVLSFFIALFYFLIQE